MMDPTFEQLETQTVVFPQQVRCAHCGEMAKFEDFDLAPDDWVCASYVCYYCSWWTEWEITHDGEDGIQSSTLYYLENDRETTVCWYEARGWPGYWKPDGFIVPDEAK